MHLFHFGVFLILGQHFTTENTDNITTPKICKITVQEAQFVIKLRVLCVPAAVNVKLTKLYIQKLPTHLPGFKRVLNFIVILDKRSKHHPGLLLECGQNVISLGLMKPSGIDGKKEKHLALNPLASQHSHIQKYSEQKCTLYVVKGKKKYLENPKSTIHDLKRWLQKINVRYDKTQRWHSHIPAKLHSVHNSFSYKLFLLTCCCCCCCCCCCSCYCSCCSCCSCSCFSCSCCCCYCCCFCRCCLPVTLRDLTVAWGDAVKRFFFSKLIFFFCWSFLFPQNAHFRTDTALRPTGGDCELAQRSGGDTDELLLNIASW